MTEERAEYEAGADFNATISPFDPHEIRIPSAVFRSIALSSDAKIVWAYLNHIADEKGHVENMSATAVSLECGILSKHVDSAIKELKTAKLLEQRE